MDIQLSDAERKQRDRHADLIERDNQLALDLEFIMADPRGRRVMRSLVGACGIFQSSYTGSSETFYREGRREVGLWIVSMIQRAAPKHLAGILTGEKND